MTVEFSDEKPGAHAGDRRAAFPGVTLIQYDKGRWRRSFVTLSRRLSAFLFHQQRHRQTPRDPPEHQARAQRLHDAVRDPADSRAGAPTRLSRTSTGRRHNYSARIAGGYITKSSRTPLRTHAGGRRPGHSGALQTLLEMPPSLKARFREIALEQVTDLTDREPRL